MSDIKTYQPKFYLQRGGSILGTISRLFQNSIPFLKSIILPEFGNFTKNVTSDYAEGAPLKSTLRRQGINSVKNIGRNVIKKVRGGSGGRKVKQRKSGNNQKKRRKRILKCANLHDDVFTRTKMSL